MTPQFSRHDDYFGENGQRRRFFLLGFLQHYGFFVPLRSQAAHRAWENFGNIAQLVEHSTENAGVVGSIPTVATKKPVSDLETGFCFSKGTRGGTHSASLPRRG